MGTGSRAKALMRELFPRKRPDEAPVQGDWEEFACACGWVANERDARDERGQILEFRIDSGRKHRETTR